MNKGIKNVLTSLFSQLLVMALGIVIPRLILVNLGSEANGLMSSINGVLTYLALLESGIGLATQQALYKPIANQDHDQVNRIMSATHSSYVRIGKIYLAIVIMIAVIYAAFVDTTISRLVVFAVILISGLLSVLYYFYSSKLSLFLVAEGRSYVNTIIATTVSVVTSLFKILILLLGGGILSLQILYFVIGIGQIIAISTYIKKHYPWMNWHVEPDYEAISQRYAVLVHKISALVFSSTDVLILTVFCSLATVSVYNMYAMMFGMMKSVAVSFSDGFVYMLGQSYGDKKRFEKLFNAYEVFNMAMTFAVFCVGYILILPFLTLYTAGVNDISYVDWKISFLFVAYYLLENGRKSSLTVASIAEKFEETKWRSVLEAVINLTCSIIFTWKYGIYGVLLGTVAGLLYRTTDAILYAAKLMEKKASITFRRWFRNLAIFALFVWGTSKLHLSYPNYFVMAGWGVVLSVSACIAFIVINMILEPAVTSYALKLIKSRLQRNK